MRSGAPTMTIRFGRLRSIFLRSACASTLVVPTSATENSSERRRTKREVDIDGTSVKRMSWGAMPRHSAPTITYSSSRTLNVNERWYKPTRAKIANQMTMSMIDEMKTRSFVKYDCFGNTMWEARDAASTNMARSETIKATTQPRLYWIGDRLGLAGRRVWL